MQYVVRDILGQVRPADLADLVGRNDSKDLGGTLQAHPLLEQVVLVVPEATVRLLVVPDATVH